MKRIIFRSKKKRKRVIFYRKKDPRLKMDEWFHCRQANGMVRDTVCIHRLHNWDKYKAWRGCSECSKAIEFEKLKELKKLNPGKKSDRVIFRRRKKK